MYVTVLFHDRVCGCVCVIAHHCNEKLWSIEAPFIISWMRDWHCLVSVHVCV